MINESVQGDALEIQHEFQQSKPFKHVEIDNFLVPEVCEGLLEDFPSFDRRKAINELGVVGGKAVFENVSAISSRYAAFYRYINSKEFLQAVSDLTGIPDLIADETLYGGGTHENLDGQYLDTHVDFNIDERRMLHRRLNVLVYLNKEWDESWGGCIELHSNPRYPEHDEIKSFLPMFNKAVIFETNEYSWHGFQTIRLPEDKKSISRKSFSIYLYTKDRPAEEAVAPHTTFYLARPFPEHVKAGEVLAEPDYQYIRGLMANRDGLIQMYQNLLVEKEQRLRDLMSIGQQHKSSGSDQDLALILSSRSWRLIMLIHRMKYRLTSFFRRVRP